LVVLPLCRLVIFRRAANARRASRSSPAPRRYHGRAPPAQGGAQGTAQWDIRERGRRDALYAAPPGERRRACDLPPPGPPRFSHPIVKRHQRDAMCFMVAVSIFSSRKDLDARNILRRAARPARFNDWLLKLRAEYDGRATIRVQPEKRSPKKSRPPRCEPTRREIFFCLERVPALAVDCRARKRSRNSAPHGASSNPPHAVPSKTVSATRRAARPCILLAFASRGA
jgi:hypothetical protein